MRDDAEFNLNSNSEKKIPDSPEFSANNNAVSHEDNFDTTGNVTKENSEKSDDNLSELVAKNSTGNTSSQQIPVELSDAKIHEIYDKKLISKSFIPPSLFILIFHSVSFFVSFVLILFNIMSLDTSNGVFMVGFLTTLITYILTLIIAAGIYKLDILSPFKVVPRKPKMAFLTVLFTLGIGNLVQTILTPVTNFAPSIEFDYSLFDDPLTFILLFVNIAILPALFEEWIFRGFLLKHLLTFGKWPAIIISGVTFGLMHPNPVQAIFAMVFGIMLGIIFVNSGGSIWLTFIIHFLNNAYVFIKTYFLYRFSEASSEMFLDSVPDYIEMILVTLPDYIFMAVAFIVLVVTAFKGKRAYFLPPPDETKPPYNSKKIAQMVFSSVSTYIFIAISVFNIVNTILQSFSLNN